MYKDMKDFNWLNLFIKVIIFVLIALLVIWLVAKVANKSSNKDFEKNMNIMKEASIEYYKKGNLPIEEAETKKVTLGDLIKMKYLSTFEKKCNRDESYSQATLVDDYYALRVELVCGKKKDYMYVQIDKDGVEQPTEFEEPIVDPNEPETPDNPETPDEPETPDNPDTPDEPSDNPTTPTPKPEPKPQTPTPKPEPNKTLYYQHVRVNKVYGNWQDTKPSGSNYETSSKTVRLYKYCKAITTEHYMIGSVSSSIQTGSTYRLRVKLNDVPAMSSPNNITVVEKKLFDSNAMTAKYLSNSSKVTFLDNNAAVNVSRSDFVLNSGSFRSSNATLSNVSLFTSGSNTAVDISVNIRNKNNLYSYQNYYFVPVYLKLKYSDNNSCITDLETNASKYSGYTSTSAGTKQVTQYRPYSYQKNNNDIKWSTSKSISGYELTGKTEYR